jgi:hypothetical protein
MEMYESLPSLTQKSLIFSSIAFAILMLLAIPGSFYFSGNSSLAEFEEDRQTLREFLKASQVGKEGSNFQSGPSQEQLINRVRSRLSEKNLLPEQIGEINGFDASSFKLAPDTIQQYGVEAKLLALNLREIVDIGAALQAISNGVKLISTEITASEKHKGYFDIIYQLVSFELPRPEVDDSDKKGSRKSPRFKGRGK